MLCYQIGVEIFQSRLGFFHLLERVVGVRTRCSICTHFSRRSEILRRKLTENSLHVTGNFLTWPIGNKLLMTSSSPNISQCLLAFQDDWSLARLPVVGWIYNNCFHWWFFLLPSTVLAAFQPRSQGFKNTQETRLPGVHAKIMGQKIIRLFIWNFSLFPS